MIRGFLDPQGPAPVIAGRRRDEVKKMSKRVRTIAGVLLVVPMADAAFALEYCVTCEGPPAMYRCVIDGTADGPGKDARVSLYCISQMATRGKHQACAVSRGAPFPCPGLTALVTPPKDLPGLPPAAAAADPQQNAADPAQTGEAAPLPPPAENPNKVPRTVEELAGQTVKSSKEGLKQAGDAIGGTAKKAGEQIGNAGSAIGNAANKTWGCITSLFSSCGDDESENAAQAPADTTATDEHRP